MRTLPSETPAANKGPRSQANRGFGFVLVMTAFAAYAVCYIFRTSFAIGDARYFVLADDQMVSMKYAANLGAGHGLVWNAGGERVEGYTNFAWVLYMALFHRVHVPQRLISACIQISGAMLLLANLAVVRALSLRIFRSDRVALLAVALVAFYFPLDTWALQGTEVGALTLLVTSCAWLAIRAFESPRIPWPLFWLLGSTTLLRPDMVVFCAIVVVSFVLSRTDRRLRALVIGTAIPAGFVVAETAFRLLYFGDPAPNTYYLKVVGPWAPRVARGAMVAGLFLLQILPLLLIIIGKRRLFQAVRREASLLFAIFAGQQLYSVWVGGDAWEWWGGSNRFVAIAMPLLMVCLAAALAAIWEGLRRAAEHDLGPAAARWSQAAAVSMSTVILLGVNYLALASVAAPTESRLAPLERTLLIIKPYQTEEDARHVKAALALREITRPDAVVAVVWAGAIPYFSERAGLDLLGKMDRRIARGPCRLPKGRRWTAFYPGHMKWDFDYSIGQLKPDVVQVPLWHLDGVDEQPMPYLKGDYEEHTIGSSSWYLRRGSPNIRWDLMSQRSLAEPATAAAQLGR